LRLAKAFRRKLEMHNGQNERENLQLEVGQSAIYEITVSPDMVNKFGGIFSASCLLHTDDEFAQRMGFKERVVNGGFTISIIIDHVAKTFGNGTILCSQNTTFLEPVYEGDRLNLELNILKRISNVVVLKFVLKGADGMIAQGNMRILDPNRS
jgi:acyl dehydratase